MVGATLMMAASVALLLALTSGGTRVPWMSPTIFALVGARWCSRWCSPGGSPARRSRFCRCNLLANPVMRVGTVGDRLRARRDDRLHDLHAALLSVRAPPHRRRRSGLALIPVIVLTTPGSMLSGRAMMHMRHYKISPYIGMIARDARGGGDGGVAGDAARLGRSSPPAWSGFGVGTVFPVATVSIQNAVERHDVGTATGAMNFFRALASALRSPSWVRSCSPASASRPSAAASVSNSRWQSGRGWRRRGVPPRVRRGAGVLRDGDIALVLLEERPLHGAGAEETAAVPAPPAE